MSERKAWTAADKALKEIYERRGITKWAQISRILSKQSGKQCRQRYHNHLDSSIKRQKWSAEEQVKLIQLQEQLGNRWAEISRSISGRSQNCVKNQFYSILRRGLRKINNIIRSRLKRYKQLEINILYKIVQTSQYPQNNNRNLESSYSLKRQIAYYGINDQGNQSFDLVKVKEVIEKIKTFCKVGSKKKIVPKKEQMDKQSEEIQSSEYRDNFPVQNKEIKELKHRRDSLYTFHLEKDEEKQNVQDLQLRNLCPSPGLIPQNSILLKRTSLSNISLQGFSPRYDVTSPKFYDIFAAQGHEHGQLSFKSPTTGLICESPYFDQLRPNFSNWHNLYPH